MKTENKKICLVLVAIHMPDCCNKRWKKKKKKKKKKQQQQQQQQQNRGHERANQTNT